MSRINFRYVPTSGDISGQSVLEQTERAINELGSEIDISVEAAQAAQQAAGQAANAAGIAQQSAEQAGINSSQALQTAQQAASAAALAETSAGNAEQQANNAVDSAATAFTIAQEAKDTASQANTTAESASATALTAQESAQQASQQVANAMAIAYGASGVYIMNTAAVDANSYDGSPDKLYLSSSEISNFPIAAPLYFEVLVNTADASGPESGNTSVTQRVWNDTTTLYTRIGSKDIVTNVTAWGGWQVQSTAADLAGKVDKSAFLGRLQNSWFEPGVHAFTVPDGVTEIMVAVQGAGSSGSQATNTADNSLAGGAGASGGFALGRISVTPGQVIPVTIGAGGAAPTGPGQTGRAGGTSSFGVYLTATGGSAPSLWYNPCNGGAASASTSGDVTAMLLANGMGGASGISASSVSNAVAVSSGASPVGPLGAGGRNGGPGSAPGAPGSMGGGGGGGSSSGATAYPGGAGGDGYVLLWY